MSINTPNPTVFWIRPVSLLLCSLLLFVAAAGCSPATGEVKGTVTYKNEPVKTGTVTILSSSGSSGGRINEDGSYVVKDVGYGEAKVVVSSIDEEAGQAFAKLVVAYGKGKDKKGPRPKPPEPKIPGNDNAFSLIPERYSNQAKSDLKVTVNGSVTEYNIKLADK